MYYGLNENCSLEIIENNIVLKNHHTEAYLFLSPKLAVLLCLINKKNRYLDIVDEIQKLQKIEMSQAKRIVDLAIFNLKDFLCVSVDKTSYGKVKIDIDEIIKNHSKYELSTVSEKPSQIHLMMTNHCNHSCVYCEKNAKFSKEKFSKNLTDFLTKDFVECILDEYVQTSIKPKFILTGGEPLLNPHILDIVREIKKYGFEITIVTKGIADLKKFEELCKCGIDTFRFSLDSHIPEKENMIAGFNTFEEITNCINIAKNFNSQIIINTVLLRENYDDIEDITKYCLSLKAARVHFVVVRPQGRCQGELALTKQQMKECKEKTLLLRKIYKDKIDIVFTCDYSNCTEDICRNCSKKYEVINVHEKGKITSCGQKIYLGSVREESLMSIWSKHISNMQNVQREL